MSIDELKAEYHMVQKAYADAGATGEPSMLLIVPGNPPTGLRKRVAPGLMGDVLNYVDGRGTAVRVKLKDVAKAFPEVLLP